MSGRYLSIMARLRSIGGFWSLGSSGRYSTPPISSLKVRLASATIAGFFRHSAIAAAITLAPASAPLWAVEVASGTPAAQWWKLMCGMLAGKLNLTIGTFQEMSPASLAAGRPGRGQAGRGDRPPSRTNNSVDPTRSVNTIVAVSVWIIGRGLCRARYPVLQLSADLVANCKALDAPN